MMPLSDAWFIKMTRLSNLIRDFELLGNEGSNIIYITFYHRSFEAGEISAYKGDWHGYKFFLSLDAALETIGNLVEHQAESNPGW
jgi:hypothetical protein